jgi:uncharacterized protein YdiU (UPF0061 family)
MYYLFKFEEKDYNRILKKIGLAKFTIIEAKDKYELIDKIFCLRKKNNYDYFSCFFNFFCYSHSFIGGEELIFLKHNDEMEAEDYTIRIGSLLTKNDKEMLISKLKNLSCSSNCLEELISKDNKDNKDYKLFLKPLRFALQHSKTEDNMKWYFFMKNKLFDRNLIGIIDKY